MLGTDELKNIVSIGIELTTEKNRNRLFEKMVSSALSIAECDAGTLYLYEDEVLKSRIMRTISMGVDRGADGERIDLPPVTMTEGNVCAYAAIHRELVNIPDVYASDRFDFSESRKYDELNGYRTGSMLVIPLEDTENQLIGVLQLMNKHNGHDDPFTEEDEFIIRSLGSMMAISLSEKMYLTEVREQMHSFVQAFATAVDARTPYNGTHTRKVTVYAARLADYINTIHAKGQTDEYFDDNRKEQLVMAAMLHDIGKMVVPLSVMNKATRLGRRLEKVEERFKFIGVCLERDMYKGLISAGENDSRQRYLADSLEFIRKIDNAGLMSDDDIARVEDIASYVYTNDGEDIPYLTEDEKKCLMIRRGTLTDEERTVMESHVVMTKRILDQVHFSKRYCNVARFAGEHHEKLNGEGYPDHLTADDLATESRMLAVCDVYDALTSKDRPYKKPMSKEKAFAILEDMAEHNEVDGVLVKYLKESLNNT